MNEKIHNVIIIGLGNLGSRHLQSLAKCKSKLNIDAVDTNQESMKIARERVTQVDKNPNSQVNFFGCLDDTRQSQYDMAIIATSSQNRSIIIKELLEVKKISNMIIEKVLFQSLDEYQDIGKLLEKKKVNAWVNCPRRSYPMYKKIKELLSQENAKISAIEVSGGNWGLACNSIHFLDLFAYLSTSQSIEVNTNDLTPIIHQSKRPDYIEFFGTIKTKFSNGGVIKLTCIEQTGDILVKIKTDSTIIMINETQGNFEKTSSSKSITKSFSIPRQSDLTEEWIKEYNQDKKISLPRYEESKELHLNFIEALLKFHSRITNKEIKRLPIT